MEIQIFSSIELSSFARALFRELKNKNYSVVHRFSISEGAYRNARSFFLRSWIRCVQYIIYPISLSVSLISSKIKKKSLIAVVTSNTFFAPLLATFFNRRVVHLVYDLFPEAMIHSGKWREGQRRVKIFRWLVGLSLKRSAVNIFLGERLKAYVESIHGSLSNSSIIPVGADERPFSSFKKWEEGSAIEILYCGNLGNMHDTQTLFDVWASGIEPSFQFRFQCSGSKRPALEQFAHEHADTLMDRLKIGSGLGQAEWIEALQSAPIALVTMSKGSEEVVMPSKTYSAMMAGQAILAIAPEESDLVDLIKRYDCGWWVRPGDSEGFQHCLKEIQSKPSQLQQKRRQAFEVAQNHFGQGHLAKAWIAIFETLQKS
ncbi:MAG: hypothetical protein CL961_00840 [Euryarchaeota archaeon]|nr:hypothetical protein [Euryarchaeota archaeon]